MTSRSIKSHGPGSALYRAEQVREMDRYVIETLGISGLTLMTRAGKAAFEVMVMNWPAARTVVIVCGAGNNAGDGYVVARCALEAGLDVRLFSVADAARLEGDARAVCEEYLQGGGEIHSMPEGGLPDCDVTVDALLGTGLDREVRGGFGDAIRAVNQATSGVLALDIPSGLHADTGIPMGCAVRADMTVTFIGLKQGLFTAEARDYTGDIMFDDLQVPGQVYQTQKASAELLADPEKALKSRPRSSHKGNNGHLLLLGGDLGYSGAIRMAAEAGARTGAGLVSVASRHQHAPLLNLMQPELMCRGVETKDELVELQARANVIAVGPGLGRSEWSTRMWAAVLETGLPMVVDADALTLLAGSPLRRDNWVLTPHPGEAGRLLQSDAAAVQRDRFGAACRIQAEYGGVCVLKGAGTIVCSAARTTVCTYGNPGMASGGTGDVLTGVIGGLVAQGFSLEQAAGIGVVVHARAGDIAAEQGERGLLATDLLPVLRRLVNP